MIAGRNALVAASLACLFLTSSLQAGGQYHVVEYPPSTQPGELTFGVTYTVWVPENVAKVRGVIVHQHGCGTGACEGGQTAAYDLHWQALARKWDCALMGPSYHQKDGQNCRLWCDPRNGSEQTFLRALKELSEKSGHPELATAPWCLWGHSGGGFWASLMQTRHPERIVAIWFRSGTAFTAWEKGEIPKPEIPEAAYRIPMIANPGAKEKDDARFKGAWTGSMGMFEAYRAKNATIAFVPDPRSAHECGDCRYMAIPFFDACLALRLPDVGSTSQTLKAVDPAGGWRAKLLGEKTGPASEFTGPAIETSWLPNERIARLYAEYITTGATSDSTPPDAPKNVRVVTGADGTREITWDLNADLESGIQQFVIVRDGVEVARLPEKPVNRFGRPLFQGMSYHDTPNKPLPELRYLDKAPAEARAVYDVIAINSVGLKSSPARAEAGKGK